MTIEVANCTSPIGELAVAVRDGRLCALCSAERWPVGRRRLERRFGQAMFCAAENPAGVISALRDYFAGALGALDSIAVDPGGTSFQHTVWTHLRTVPAGCTVSYGHVARSVGTPAAVRAVGAANGANPIAIVIPCHRVIGADGRLTGYAGGVERKRWLLRHEGAALC